MTACLSPMHTNTQSPFLCRPTLRKLHIFTHTPALSRFPPPCNPITVINRRAMATFSKSPRFPIPQTRTTSGIPKLTQLKGGAIPIDQSNYSAILPRILNAGHTPFKREEYTASAFDGEIQGQSTFTREDLSTDDDSLMVWPPNRM